MKSISRVVVGSFLCLVSTTLAAPPQSAGGRWAPTLESISGHQVPAWLNDAKIGIQFVGEPKDFNDQQCYQWMRAAQRARQLGAVESDAALRARLDGFKVVGGIQYVWNIRPPANLDQMIHAYQRTGAKFLVSMLQAAYPGTEGLLLTRTEAAAARRAGFKVGIHYNLLRRERSPSMGDPGYVDWYRKRVKSEVQAIDADFLFFDGCQAPSDYFKTPELVSWFYNWADRNGKQVWVNEDLGIDCRESEKYGDVIEGEGFTISGISHKTMINWDTLRNEWNCWVNEFGIHKRDGSKWEWSYREPSELLQVFIYNVSVGGVWCVQMVNTRQAWANMYEIGDWLAVNGEAIYGTRPNGPPDPNAVRLPSGKNPIISGTPPLPAGSAHWLWRFQQTVAVAKQKGPVYFTRRGNTLYAIHWGWPGKLLTLHNLTLDRDATIRMLGVDQDLASHRDGDNIVIEMPVQRPCQYAYSLKITGSVPRIARQSSLQ